MFKKLFLTFFLLFFVTCSHSSDNPSPQVQKPDVLPPVQRPVGMTGVKPVNSEFINVSGTAVKEKRAEPQPMNNEQ